MIKDIMKDPLFLAQKSTDATKALSAKQGKALKDTADLLATTVGDKLTADEVENQLDSTATTAAGIVTDFNLLLAKLKTAGVMAADA